MRNQRMSTERRTIVVTDRPAAPRSVCWGRRAALGAGLAAAFAALARVTLGKGGSEATEQHFDGDVFHRALDASRALVSGRLSQAVWQDVLEAVFRTPLPEQVSREVRLDDLLAHAPEAVPIRGAAVVPFSLPLPGAPLYGFGTKLFVLRAGRANPPHGHDNLVALTYVLRGRFRVRHYERIREEPEGIVLKPTIERVLRPGDATSISDIRDNVHWHEAETDGVMLAVYCKDLGGRATQSVLLDPVNAKDLGGGLFRAPRLSSLGEALERFG